MEIGNEIGQKIRSAIKAKLVELGAYVDDELPDYIMVMVANKKTQAQMAEDLNLFLSGNTQKFTTWLHNLLEKLQSLTNESNAVAKVPQVTENIQLTSPQNKDNLAPAVSIEQQTRISQFEKVPSVRVVPIIAEQFSVDLRHESDINDESVLSGIKLVAENNEFDEESIAESKPEVKVIPQPDVASVPAVSLKSKYKETRKVSVNAFEQKHKRPSENCDEKDYIQPKTKVARVDARKRLGTIPKATNNNMSMRSPSKSHRSVMSSVGAVLHHNDDQEEEYDPNRPSIGSVASVVRVTERKSSVPLALQANKSLLLRAMQQAEQSVARAKSLTEPSQTSMTDTQRRSALSRLGLQSASDRQVLQQHSRKVKSRKTDSREPEIMKTFTIRSSVQETSLPAVVDEDTMSDQSTSEHSTEAGLVVERQLDNSTLDVDEAEPDQSDLEMESAVDENSVDDDITAADVDDDEDNRQHLIHAKERPLSNKDNRKFVVTLQDLKQSLMDDYEVLDDEQEMVLTTNSRNVVRVSPQTQYSQHVDQAGDLSVVKKPQSTEKCKFWPGCKNAEACPFHHPSVPCRTFPKCRFGDSCLYIHPQCKFDATCRNARCPYSHTAPHRPAPASNPVPLIVQPIRVPVYMSGPPPFAKPRFSSLKQIKCKFFPKCTDFNCPYQHPKPCHYGANCANRNTSCPFIHPDWPDKKSMKWTAPSVRQSSP